MTKERTVDRSREPILWILLLLVSFASISAVLFTPALPELTQKLHITPSQAQFTITIFLVGYSIGNLPYGPLSNRYGRKFTLYIGIVVALISAILTVLVDTFQVFWLLILGRFLLALGSCAGFTVAFTMVGDIYPKKVLAKKISYFMLMFAIAPNLSVVLGGFLTSNFGWVSCFYFLIAYSLVLFVAATFLPETIEKIDEHALNMSTIRNGYVEKLKDKKVVVASILMGGGVSAIYLFASEAPFIGIRQLGLTPDIYGLLNFIPPIGLIVGSLLANIFAGKKEPLTLLSLGIFISLVSSAIMFFLFFFGNTTVWSFFFPVPFIYVGVSLVLANSSAIVMTYARNKANGSAIMSFISLGICVLVLLGVEMVASHEPYLMPITFVCVFFLMFLIRKYLAHIIYSSQK